MTEAAPRRADWTIVKCSSFDEMRDRQLQAWRAVSSAERMKASWEMVKEAWALKHRNPDELRLLRSVTAVCKARG